MSRRHPPRRRVNPHRVDQDDFPRRLAGQLDGPVGDTDDPIESDSSGDDAAAAAPAADPLHQIDQQSERDTEAHAEDADMRDLAAGDTRIRYVDTAAWAARYRAYMTALPPDDRGIRLVTRAVGGGATEAEKRHYLQLSAARRQLLRAGGHAERHRQLVRDYHRILVRDRRAHVAANPGQPNRMWGDAPDWWAATVAELDAELAGPFDASEDAAFMGVDMGAAAAAGADEFDAGEDALFAGMELLD